MNKPKSFLKKHITGMVAIVFIIAIYLFARPPEISQKESIQLVNQFSFATFTLPELEGDHSRSVREVHPQLTNISGWISAVGAAVAINDLDNDSYSNDVCYVDTRTDEVVIAPIPGTGSRFTPFALALPKAEPGVGVAPMGCIPSDMNEDGLMDVLVYYWGRTPIAYLQKTTQSPKTLSAESFFAHPIGNASQRWHTNAATMADFDGDGHIDIAIGNYFPDGARVLDSNSSEKQTMHKSMTRAFNGGRNCFLRWKNATSGSTPTVSYEMHDPLDDEIAQGWTLGLGAADLDGDLLPELYVSNDFGPDRLLHNRSQPGQLKFVVVNGRKTLAVPNSKVLGNDAFKGMGIDFGDINNDGHLDMYVSNIAAEWALQESHFMWVNTTQPEALQKGEAPFVDESEPLGLARSSWGWESRLDDFNNDGILEAVQATGFLRGEVNRWPELHEVALSNDDLINLPEIWFRCKLGDDISGHDPNRFFVRSKSGRFYDIAQEIGMGQPLVSRGIATADVDGDGDLDMAVANQWDRSLFYRNDSNNENAYIGLKLVLPLRPYENQTSTIKSGLTHVPQTRPAIGASVKLTTSSGLLKVAQVDGGNGHSGARSSNIHFGLGKEKGPFMVNIRYRDPDGNIQEENITLDSGWKTIVLKWPSKNETWLSSKTQDNNI